MVMMGYGICLIKSGLLSSRREVLDWYHLRENLHKVGGSLKRKRRVESQLWQGSTVEAIAEASRS